MKALRLLLALLVAMLTTGCPVYEPDIVLLDLNIVNSYIVFSAFGGTDTACIHNDNHCDRWHILLVENDYYLEGTSILCGSETYAFKDFVQREPDMCYNYGYKPIVLQDSLRMDCDRLTVLVPDDEPQSIIVECERNESDTISRYIIIYVQTHCGKRGCIIADQRSLNQERELLGEERFAIEDSISRAKWEERK